MSLERHLSDIVRCLINVTIRLADGQIVVVLPFDVRKVVERLLF
jgi:hypothetical protein